ncbi:MAG: DUF45 domain-containing protein [Hymenobacteraceae bacterium]|nr:DUF45 domain-containing protein [Hymenobacteraceae bacterium]
MGKAVAIRKIGSKDDVCHVHPAADDDEVPASCLSTPIAAAGNGLLPAGGSIVVLLPHTILKFAVRKKGEQRPAQSFVAVVDVGQELNNPVFGNTGGETNYCRGRGYRLRLREAEAPAGVKLSGSFIELQVRPETTVAQRAQVLQAWYRARLKEQLPPLLAKWETAMDVKAADWGVKLMKTKWGAGNIEARRIWLNLVQAPLN